MKLHALKNTTRPYKRRKLLGRGMGSGRGKTCTRGHKGAGSRSGWKSRERYEGGQLPLYRKVPARGFANARFRKRLDAITLAQIEKMFSDGELVSVETLMEKGIIKGSSYGIKVLSNGKLTKKVRIQAVSFSKNCEEKLAKAKIEFTVT